MIKGTVNILKDKYNQRIRSQVLKIVTRLTNDGIKKYMEKWYNEQEQANVIEIIFNKIILERFGKEYNQFITTTKNNNYNGKHGKYYQNLIFSSSDLMTLIFQYVNIMRSYRFDGDLLSCSLVNSYWLYHAWNINSVHFVRLEALIWQTLSSTPNSNVTRMWQRLINVKSINLCLTGTMPENDLHSISLLLNRLCVLKNIDTVKLVWDNDGPAKMDILKILIFRSAEKIKHCDIRIGTSKENMMLPLRLTKAQYIGIYDLYFYRIWSNKCQILTLEIKNISKDWCQFVINQCDCSNIKYLKINVTFDDKSIDETILEQLASKFAKLQQLNICFVHNFRSGGIDMNVILFWKLLNGIILQNNGRVELDIEKLHKDHYSSLNVQIRKHKLKIDKLTMKMIAVFDPRPAYVIGFIKQRDESGLRHLVIQASMNTAPIVHTRLIKEVSFESIQIAQLNSRINEGRTLAIKDVIEFLGLDKIIETQLIIIVDVGVHWEMQLEPSKAVMLFGQLCKNVLKLIKNGIGINIKILFAKYSLTNKIDKAFFNQCLTTYTKYFQRDKLLPKYIKPKFKNQSYCPCVKPYTYFVQMNDEQFAMELRVANALHQRSWM